MIAITNKLVIYTFNSIDEITQKRLDSLRIDFPQKPAEYFDENQRFLFGFREVKDAILTENQHYSEVKSREVDYEIEYYRDAVDNQYIEPTIQIDTRAINTAIGN